MAFPDHHSYGARDLQAVARRARAVGASLLVTTEKDAVRLRRPGALGAASGPELARQAGEALPPVWALRVRLEPVAGPPIDAWRAELRSRVDAAARETRTERAP